MDKQFAFAVILVIGGIAMMQAWGEEDSPFFAGIGLGTVLAAAAWIAVLIARDLKRR